MAQLTVNVQVKFSENEAKYLNILSKKYRYKRCQFIRDAVREKMQKDVPILRDKLRKELEKLYCPF